MTVLQIRKFKFKIHNSTYGFQFFSYPRSPRPEDKSSGKFIILYPIFLYTIVYVL